VLALLVSPHLSKQAWFTVKVGMMLAAELITCAADRFMPYSTDEGLIANSADIMAICWKRSCIKAALSGLEVQSFKHIDISRGMKHSLGSLHVDEPQQLLVQLAATLTEPIRLFSCIMCVCPEHMVGGT